jgi:hypothetical protein
MGLLDTFFGDPSQTQALGLLGAGLMAGRPAAGFEQALGLLSPDAQIGRKLKQAQLEDINQQIGLRNIQLQQQQAQWGMLAPLMQQYVGGLAGGAPASTPAQAPASQGGALGSGTFGIPIGNQSPAPAPASPASAPSGGSSMFGVPRDVGIPTLLFGGPQELAKTISSYNTPTDFQKLLAASGIDPSSALGKQLTQAQIAKLNNIPLQAGRAGAPMYNAQGEVVAMAPKIPDNAIPQIENGRVVGVTPLPGGNQIAQTNAYAAAAGKAQTTPMTAYKGMNPVFTNQLVAAQQGDVQPQPGVAGKFDFSKDSPEAISAAIESIPNPQDRANARAAFEKQLRANSQPLTPGLAPGVAESQGALAGGNAKRYNDALNLAADSKMRVNVYDNILNLSREGIQTGPTSQFQNNVKGVFASVPGVDSLFPGVQKDVSNFQELNKFLYQNAQRNWQAAGGTGTDAQLEAFSHSSPNDKMFPQALQAMAQWGKAGELALQGKTDAMQAWKDAQGGNVANLDQFEKVWRNNFDPVLYQLKVMDPAQQTAFVNNLKFSNPKGYQALMAKAQSLKQLGGL